MTVVAGIVISFAPPQYFERMQTIANYQEEGSAMGRIVAWKAGARMAMRYPVTGVGSGHFPVALGTEFRPPEFGDQNLPWLTAHSMYFLVLGELGLPGIICFLGLLAANFRRATRLFKEVRGSPGPKEFEQLFLMLSASVVAFSIGGAFLSVAYYPHVFVLSGLVAASVNIYRNTASAAPDDLISEHAARAALPSRKNV
jgi:O-antigen ligase